MTAPAETIEFAEPGEDLLSAVAHALRTPLAALVGFTELLRTRDDDQTRRRAVARIGESVERLSVAVEHVLAAFAADSGSLLPQPAAVDLGLVVGRAIAGPPPAAEADGGPWPVVLADDEWLERALEMVVWSARSRSSAVSPIRVSAEEKGGCAVVTVAYSGTGAGDSEAALGLYAARRLVELQGGSAWAAGGADGAESLVFTVPLAARARGGMRRILIVDDDKTVRSLLRLTLPTQEFAVVEASGSEEAFALAGEGPLDLVLLDWRMPVASGAAVLAELKSSQPGVPVVVLTADLDRRTREVAESLGADAFLTKPFSPLELLDTVERLLPAPGEGI